jgi:hypothetical protein
MKTAEEIKAQIARDQEQITFWMGEMDRKGREDETYRPYCDRIIERLRGQIDALAWVITKDRQ